MEATEHITNETPPVETPAVPPAVESAQVEQPRTEAAGGTEAASSSWITDTHRELAPLYDHTEDDLKGFSSAADYARSLRLIDRYQSKSREAQQPAAPQQAQSSPAQAAPAAAPAPSLKRFDLEALKAEGYEGKELDRFAIHNQALDQIEAMKAEREKERAESQQMREYLSGWEQQRQQAELQRYTMEFHNAVDNLSDTRLGKVFDERGLQRQLSKDEISHREQVWATANSLMQRMAERGQAHNIRVDRLVQQAQQIVFADDIKSQARAEVIRGIEEQSKNRRPVAQQPRNQDGTFATLDKINPFTNRNEYVQAVANTPELVAKFNKYQQEAGLTV